MKDDEIFVNEQYTNVKHLNEQKDKVESYLNYMSTKYKYFIAREHKEFNNEVSQKEFVLKNTKVALLKDIEVEYKKEFENEIKDYIKQENFDMVIMNICDDGSNDYAELPKLNEKEIEHYYNKVKNAIESVEFNVLAHLDYPFRYNKYDKEEIEIALVDEIVASLIKRNIALEFNTTSAFLKGNLDYYVWLFTKYYQHGGQSIIISSDAYTAKFYKYKFKETLNILLNIGFDQISYFLERKEYKLNIREILKYYE